MYLIFSGSMAFSIGAAFMKSSNGFTRLAPTMVVGLSFLIGSALIARAVQSKQMTTTIVLGLGIEATLSVLIGLLFLGERLSAAQAGGIVMVMAGVGLLQR